MSPTSPSMHICCLRPLKNVHTSARCSPLYTQGHKKIVSEKLNRISELIEPWFTFALVWSIGATCDNYSRWAFSQWLRIKMDMENVRGGTPLISAESLCLGVCGVKDGANPRPEPAGTGIHTGYLLVLPCSWLCPSQRRGWYTTTGWMMLASAT